MASAEPLKERRRRHWGWSAYLTGGLLLLLAALPPAEERDEGAAYAAGWFVGIVALVLGAALALRAVYAKLIRRDGRPVWSPWVFVMVGVIALLMLVGRAST